MTPPTAAVTTTIAALQNPRIVDSYISGRPRRSTALDDRVRPGPLSRTDLWMPEACASATVIRAWRQMPSDSKLPDASPHPIGRNRHATPSPHVRALGA